MGVTGLETAFSVLHTELVVPGVLELELLVERMTAGAAAFDFERADSRARKRGERRPDRSRRRVGGGSRGMGEPLLELVLRGPAAARPGPDDRRRGSGRLPPAQLRDGGGGVRRGTEVGRAELAHRVAGAKLDPARAALVVIDVQEAFRKAVPVFDDVARAAGVLVEGAKVGRDPDRDHRAVPEGPWAHRARGRGRTFRRVWSRSRRWCFSAAEADGFDLGGADQALVCGIETHVCVNQTVLDLLAEGVDVHVAEDAVGSRSKQNWRLGLRRSSEPARR